MPTHGCYLVAITIGGNIASLMAQRQLAKSTASLSSSFERLSSGMRINRASDDAAGLAVATTLHADARVYAQAIRNVNDGISLLSVVDGSLGELSNIVARLKELAESAANGTYSTTQRQAMTNESRALTDEWNRIIQTTSFNGAKLLNLSNGTVSIQAGIGSSGILSIDLGRELDRAVGDGTFQAGVTYSLPALNPENIAAYDFNGDGIQDLITTNQNSVNVFIGNGDGTLRAGTSFVNASVAGTASLFGVVLADFNNDGKIDVATTSDGDDTIDILFGNGNGTFRAFVSYAGGADPTSLGSGDFDNDGIIDLVATNQNGGTAMSFYKGNADGSFRARVSYATNAFPTSVQVGDLNNDGFLDVVVSAGNGPSTDIFLGRGDGTFNTAVSYASGAGLRAPALLDANGDDYLDIVIPALTDTSINILINNGNGTFKARTTIMGGISSIVIKAADINGDGYTDFVSNGANALNVFLSNGDGTFRATQSVASSSRQFTFVDLNRDGVSDIALADEAGDKIWIHLANSTAVTTLARPTINTQAQARDFLGVLDATADRIALERGQVGAMQSRFSVASQNLHSLYENYRTAEGRIRDVDVAEESAELIRQQILQQVGAAMLAQANQMPALVLKLLT